ncbi:unnamed protein product [Trifolium pratense]|uniref:Uncharacterized protein n=1 Tax=Trifolium pratense TaxID=57577 RepID=A0ACB0IZL7_TRIPR|nr:unnamed protein product [Trifolium pratense]
MASSGVEIASSAPFGCVLRDRNHRDVCRESSKVKATHVAFQRNIKNFVMDHFNTSFSMADSSTTNENNINSSRNNSNNNNNNNESQMNNNNLAKIRLTRNNHNYDVNNNNNKGDKDESPLASLISAKNSRLLDRWAAKQAREMVSTLQNEAELLSIDNNIPVSSETSSIISDECSSDISNLGASSLVQLWEKRLNNSSGSKPSTPMEKTSPNDGTTNATCNNENVYVVEEQRGLELGECFEGQESFSISSFPDWESDKTGDQSRSCSRDQSRWCSAESDRVSVADIIKKLTATSQMQSPPPYFADENDHEVGGSSTTASSPCRDFVPELPDQRAFPQVTCLPRIRGRQAFKDLLMQLENDRHRELKNLAEHGTVSKFAQRGRIQAVLRLRLLQRGVAANNLLQKSTSSEVNRQVQPHGSAIMQLSREKFSTVVEQKSTVKTEVANTRSPRKEAVNTITQLENSSVAAQISKDTSSQVPHGTASQSFESTQKSVSQTREEDGPSSNVMSQETCFKAQHDYFKETAEPTTSMTDSNANEKAVEENNQQCDETSYDCALEEEGSNHNYAESSYEEIVEEIYDENHHDWISEISRPRSFWEEKRQAWYREILDNGSRNKDIQVLLQRTVSTFLSSDFREKMDRMLQSHKGTQTHIVNTYDDDEDNEGLMAFFLERLHSARTSQENGIERMVDEEKDRVNEEDKDEEEEDDNEEEDDEEDDDDDEEEEEREEEQGGKSLASSLYHEVGDYSNQSSPWSYRDNEAGDDFDRVASTSSLPYQSPSFYHDSRRNSPSTNQHSIEMDIIYDMRGHMEQLHQEMTELRKSIKSCLDMQMQMQLQQSNNQRVQTVEKEEKKSHNKAGKKGNCCICYKMKVDSVLYRCGHMCACLKCANELQWNSGKCPICKAKIDDVVRVYADA